MKLVDLVCPNCGGSVQFSEDKKTIVCQYCNHELHFQEELDRIQGNNAAGIKEFAGRAYDLIRQEKYVQAETVANEGLKAYPYAGRLHLALLLCELNVPTPAALGSYGKDYTTSDNFKSCLLYMTTEDQKDLLALVEQNKTAVPQKSEIKGKYEVADNTPQGQYTQTMIDAILKQMDNIIEFHIIYKKDLDEPEEVEEFTRKSFVEECGYVHDCFKREVREKWFKDIVEKHRPEMDEIFDIDEMKAKLPGIFNKIVAEYKEVSDAEDDKMMKELAAAEEAHNAEREQNRSKLTAKSVQQVETKNKRGKKMANKDLKKKKKLLVFLSISLALILIGVILLIVGFVKVDGDRGAGLVLIIVGLIPLAIGAIMAKITSEVSVKYCGSCGGSMKGCEYEYQFRSQRVDGNRVKVTYDIVGYCPKCGEPNHTIKEFAPLEGANPDATARNYCRRKFGH